MKSTTKAAVVALLGISLGTVNSCAPYSALAAEKPTEYKKGIEYGYNPAVETDAPAEGLAPQELSAQGWGWIWHPRDEADWAVNTSMEFAPGNFSVTDAEGDKLVYQTDGNLVLYAKGRARWQSGTSGVPGGKLAMQGDGNVVIYQMPGSIPRWQSGAYQAVPGQVFGATLTKYAVHVNRRLVLGCREMVRATTDAQSWVRPGGWSQIWNSGDYCL